MIDIHTDSQHEVKKREMEVKRGENGEGEKEVVVVVV